MRILVVDDEPAVREALERILRLDGFEVALASDGREAVRSQAAAPADAVLLDVLMPGLDGLEVCRRMRDTGDRTPVLMLTARDKVGDRVAGLEAGADDYLPKPFALEELLARVRALLRRSGWSGERSAGRPPTSSASTIPASSSTSPGAGGRCWGSWPRCSWRRTSTAPP
jgi:two-component system response regulator MprA